MTFATSIQCMDGRVQLPLISYIMDAEQVDYVDVITEPGPCKILSEQSDAIRIQTILERLEISVTSHESEVIYISGHYDCTANAVTKEVQIQQVEESIHWLRNKFRSIRISGLWINENGKVEPIHT